MVNGDTEGRYEPVVEPAQEEDQRQSAGKAGCQQQPSHRPPPADKKSFSFRAASIARDGKIARSTGYRRTDAGLRSAGTEQRKSRLQSKIWKGIRNKSKILFFLPIFLWKQSRPPSRRSCLVSFDNRLIATDRLPP